MRRVADVPTLPTADQEAAYRMRLHDYLREHAVAINQAADQRIFQPVAITTTYSAGENDHVILAAPSAPFTITLPAASQMIYKRVVVKRSNNTTHTITIQSSSGNIDGAASTTLTTAYQAKEFYSDGSAYWSI